MDTRLKIGHRGLIITHLNLGGLLSKFELVKLDMAKSGTHIAAFSESWLKKEIPSAMVEIDGFQMVRQDRQSNIKTKGGGLCVYIREDFIYDTKKYSYLNHTKESSEMLWLTIKPGGLKKIILGIVYRRIS